MSEMLGGKEKGDQGALETKGGTHFKKKWQIMLISMDKMARQHHENGQNLLGKEYRSLNLVRELVIWGKQCKSGFP